MFIGEVEDAEVLAEKEVMTYAYYHQVKNGTTPKNAPSFQEKTEKSGWRCSICGYIYEGDPLQKILFVHSVERLLPYLKRYKKQILEGLVSLKRNWSFLYRW